MSVSRALVALVLLGVGNGCTQADQSVDLASLQASGAVSFMCLAGDDGRPVPREMRDCPDVDDEDGEFRRSVAMVTQTTRGEVAVLDATDLRIIDQERRTPGYNFLPVGGDPVDIVSTPGSVATFVAVGEVGAEGIFALPSSCVGERLDEETPRDITTWPACRLPTTPGRMAVLVDPEDAQGNVRASCDDAFMPVGEVTGVAAGRAECPADLATEVNPLGRRKLLVTLPEWGEIAVIDAQSLLDREPGTFEPCELERRLLLDVDLPENGARQRPPADLDVEDCELPGLNHGPVVTQYKPRPAGLALADDRTRLYVADRQAPVIHVLDTSRPCELTELPPLLPAAFTDPTRVVTTKALAVSPLTSDARRYLYAIDEDAGGSAMAFDVSSDSTDRTPLLRERSARIPFEPPDRITFGAPAVGVTFAFLETAIADPALGSSIDAVACDPDPDLPETDPAAERRATADPETLRGVFGFLALSSGHVAVVDIDDRDAACRRPLFTNTSDAENFRGCKNDPQEGLYIERGSDRATHATVTAEASCQVVQPHRSRSSNLVRTDSQIGVASPALKGFPLLTSDNGRRLATDQTEDGRRSPKLLGVDFSPTEPAEVFVGSTLFKRGEEADATAQDFERLDIDPATAELSSLVLDVAEPRTFPPSERWSARYEGVVLAEQNAARLRIVRWPLPGAAGAGRDELVLQESDLVLCDGGIEDERLMRERALRDGLLGEDPSEAALDAFQVRHADYVTITSEIPPEESTYWTTSRGATCGDADPGIPGDGHAQCSIRLGTRQAPTTLRELRIHEAHRSTLVLKPRHHGTAEAQAWILEHLLPCCFPEPVSYEVRASHQWVVRGAQSRFRHHVRTEPGGTACQNDCNPLRADFDGRAFEVSCASDTTCPVGADGEPVIGVAEPGEVACVVDAPTAEQRTLGGVGSQCIFANQTSRFVIYRGLELSARDMSFSWEVIGGFVPRVVDLGLVGTPSANTVPLGITYSRETGFLVIPDGATKGLMLIPTGNLRTGASLF